MKKTVVFSTRRYKPDKLAYFKAGRYIGETFPNAGSCAIIEDHDENGYCLRVIVTVEGEKADA